jgi:hypothetical protein
MARPKTDRKIFVRIQLNEVSFADVAEWAAKSGIRDKSCILYTKIPNGLATDLRPNTKGIAKYFQFCHRYYKDQEPKRLKEQAEALRVMQEAAAKAKELGVKI